MVTAYAAWRGQAAAGDRDVHLVIAGARGWFYDADLSPRGATGAGGVGAFPRLCAGRRAAGVVPGGGGVRVPEPIRGVRAAGAGGDGVRDAGAVQPGAGCGGGAGDAALTAPPVDVTAWVAGLALVTGQAGLRAELRRRGLARAAELSWRRAAEATLACMTRFWILDFRFWIHVPRRGCSEARGTGLHGSGARTQPGAQSKIQNRKSKIEGRGAAVAQRRLLYGKLDAGQELACYVFFEWKIWRLRMS